MRVRRKSTAVSGDPIRDGARGGDAESHTGVTICPTGQWIAVGVNHRDKEGEQSDS